MNLYELAMGKGQGLYFRCLSIRRQMRLLQISWDEIEMTTTLHAMARRQVDEILLVTPAPPGPTYGRSPAQAAADIVRENTKRIRALQGRLRTKREALQSG